MKALLLALILWWPSLVTTSILDYAYIPAVELTCLAKNIYYEARGEPVEGQLAVALVTLNRLEDSRYPDTICKVVYQKYQFSWTIMPKGRPLDLEAWYQSNILAFQAYQNRDILGEFEATHFHANYVKPRWKLKRITQIGRHIFYG